MVKSFDYAFQQVGYQVAGHPIQIVVGDSQADSAKAIDVARRMVENDKVAMIVGPLMAGEQMAVAGYINQVGIPAYYTNSAPGRLLGGSNKWVILGEGAQAQIPSVMGAYAYEQLGYRKLNIITNDNESGRGFLGPLINSFKKRGGQIVQEQYTVYPCQDYAPYLTVLKDANGVAAWTEGTNAIKLLSQYHEMGIYKKFPLMGAYMGNFLVPFIIRALPPAAADALVGTPVPVVWSPLVDNPVSKQFVSAYTAAIGMPTDDSDSSPYQGGLAIIKALQATNGDTTPDKLRQALLSVNFEGPEGPVKFDPQAMAPIKTLYIAKVAKRGNAFVLEPVFTYKDVPPAGY
jgi:branched-chain amino acid transport system substrate-binding protein